MKNIQSVASKCLDIVSHIALPGCVEGLLLSLIFGMGYMMGAMLYNH